RSRRVSRARGINFARAERRVTAPVRDAHALTTRTMMAKLESLGIKRIEAIHYYVRNLERSRHFYVDRLDFAEIGESSHELTEAGKQHSLVFAAADCTVICSQPVGEGGRAHRYLKKHPDGIGTLVFEVEDVKKTFDLLEERGGTPIEDIQRFEDDTGTL